MPRSQVIFQCPPDLKQKITEMAKADRRSTSQWVRIQLERAVEQEAVSPNCG